MSKTKVSKERKKYKRILDNLTDREFEFLTRLIRTRNWYRYHKYFEGYFPEKDDLKRFVSWYKLRDEEKSREQADEDLDKFLHNRSYWYDVSEDKYIIHLRSKKRPLILGGSFWRDIKKSYSNWSGSSSSVNEICRKFSITRTTLTELLKVMGVTHDSSPFTEERMLQSSESELVEELIRQKEESVLLKSKQREYSALKRDAERFRIHSIYAKELNLLLSEGTKSLPKITSLKLKKSASPYCLLLSPTDFHWGKYAAYYTGDEYNRTLAEERLFDCTSKLLDRIQKDGLPEKIVLGLGGDGLHIDNIQKNTTKGTPQDVDGSPLEIAFSYIDLCKRYVLYLSQLCDVDVYVINGNHDFYSTVFLRAALVACFDSVENINVCSDLNPRQTFVYGNSLITFVHGDDGNVKDYPIIVATENPKEWGESKWRYIFTGHLHTERELPQFGDTVVYRMPSLAGTDDWHFKKGYSGRKALIGYKICSKLGVITTHIVPVDKSKGS